MAKVAEYNGTVSVREEEGKIVLSMEFLQGEIRTSIETSLTPGGFVKALRGQKVETVVFEGAVQTRRKPKEAE